MAAVTRPSRSPLGHHWSLDPDVVFLNHGSFGATPIAVLAKQSELRARLEREPVRFMVHELESLLDASRNELAAFVGADPKDLVFVQNATTGVNAVLSSLALHEGDELLTTTHEYNACKNALEFVAKRAGARVILAELPFPITSEQDAIDAIVSRVTTRTRLLLVDHVTSATGLVLPIAKIAEAMSARGVPVLVDGAHGPGMVDVDLRSLGVAYYAANCHKWICAPKGAALLWVRRDLQERVRPTVISHGANVPPDDRGRFHREFDWVGTGDPTAFLCVGEAIRFIASLAPGGWPEVRARNRALALEGRRILGETLGVAPPCPDSMIGSLASLPIADGEPAPSPLYTDPRQTALFQRFGIEVPIMPFPGPRSRVLRISAAPYNTREEYAYLADALKIVGC
jgi:isopenicillin-N epimerase